jgi:hypothetical protein
MFSYQHGYSLAFDPRDCQWTVFHEGKAVELFDTFAAADAFILETIADIERQIEQ